MKIAPNKRVLIAGKTQSGKSHFTKKVILSSLSSYIIYDMKREYSAFGVVVRSIPELKAKLAEGCKKIVYQMQDFSLEHFGEVSDFIYFNLRRFVFVIDEIQNFVTRSKMPDGFKRLVFAGEGEPRYLGIIGTSQRPANVNTDFKAQISVCVCFRFVLPHDAEALEHFFTPEKLLSLEKYHFYVWNDDNDAPVTRFKPVS